MGKAPVGGFSVAIFIKLTVKEGNNELSTANKPEMLSLRCNRACYTTIQLLVATRQGTIAS